MFLNKFLVPNVLNVIKSSASKQSIKIDDSKENLVDSLNTEIEIKRM